MSPCVESLGKKQRAWPLLVLFSLSCLWLVSADPCEQVHAPPIKRKPHPPLLIGIGAQKSGTSFIFNALKTHPQIIRPEKKELHTFDSETFQPSQASYNEYIRHWGGWKKVQKKMKGHVLLEITPKYLEVDKVPCYIKQFFPDAKFVVTLRHPVDRTMSYLNMMRSRCMQKKEADPKKQLACCEDVFSDIAERLALSVENMRGASQQCLNVSSSNPWHGCPIDKVKPLDRSLYATQIAHWFKVFHPSQFIFINSNKLFQDPIPELNRVVKFMGLSTKWNIQKKVNNVWKFKAPKEYIDPDVDLLRSMVNDALEENIQDLYRLFDENGIDFPKLKAQKEKKGVQKVPVGAALKFCCKGGCPHPTTDFNSALPLLNNSSDSFTDDFGDNSPDKTIDASQQGPAFSLSQNSADNEILSVKSVNYSAGFVTDDSTANSIDEPALSTPDDLAVKPNQLRLESVFTRTVQTSSISSPTIAVSLFPIFIVVLWWVWKKEGENHRAHRGSLSFQGVKGTQ